MTMAADEDKCGSLEEEAKQRRERLKNLRKRSAAEVTSSNETETKALQRPKFRSYNPQDEKLKENTVQRKMPETVEDQVKSDIDEAKKQKPIIEEVDLLNLAPRKPDWDLKRDVAKKLDKLERRTQRAIVEIIRERIKSGEEDLTVGVNSASKSIESDED